MASPLTPAETAPGQLAADCSALGPLTQITDAAFTEYGVNAETISTMRHRFATWRKPLLAS